MSFHAYLDAHYARVPAAKIKLADLMRHLRVTQPALATEWPRSRVLAELSRQFQTAIDEKVVFVLGLAPRGAWIAVNGRPVFTS